MPITTNEVTKRLKAFAANPHYQSMSSEKADEKIFTKELLQCFDIGTHQYNREYKVEKLDDSTGYLDAFIPKKLIIEAKTKGIKLTKARNQAEEYRSAIKLHEQPKYILLHNFAEFELFNLVDDTHHKFTLEELPKNAKLFSFLYSDDEIEIVEENPINREAAYQISRLHASLVNVGYVGRNLEIFLTRLLFCFFADDTLIFSENGMVNKWLQKSSVDGDDLGSRLQRLFTVLNTPEDKRQKTLNDDLAQFSYVNGGLFAEPIELPEFDSDLRALLLQSSRLDWSFISPAIFGGMFQGVLEERDEVTGKLKTKSLSRAELGAHYTSEKNILKVINPLFMDELRERLKSTRSHTDLFKLQEHIASLKFLDPACGCGNFLVIAYRELRRFEHDLIEKLYGTNLRQQIGLQDAYIKVSINQFYGIEYEQHATEIAKVALYITDHQMNIEAANRFGQTRPTIPLVATPTIVTANALRFDWNELLPANECSYVIGNPPFRGKSKQTKEQKEDFDIVFSGVIDKYSSLDYVAAWYIQATKYSQLNSQIISAFVSTNSIVQGEQVSILWAYLFQSGMQIEFAHQTFKWKNEGKDNAAVHCVIIAFSPRSHTLSKTIYTYEKIDSEPKALKVEHINGYLTGHRNLIIGRRTEQISNEDAMVNGGKPTATALLLSDDEKRSLVSKESLTETYLRPFSMGEEFLHNELRWCLWFHGHDPVKLNKDLKLMPNTSQRINEVKTMRENSTKSATREKAQTPHLFDEIRYSKTPYLAIPKVSSETRRYIPIGYLSANVICGDKLFFIPNASKYIFGMLNSTMHNAWMRTVAGRLESRYSYSNTIVYNNFPFPFHASEREESKITPEIKKAITNIEAKAQAILDTRAKYENEAIAKGVNPPSLADLYRVGLIDAYPELTKAHKALDKAVDAAYGYKGKDDDASRVAFLFERYEALTKAIAEEEAAKKKIKKTKTKVS